MQIKFLILFFLFFSCTLRKHKNEEQKTNNIIDSKSLCSKILEDSGFAMLPGLDFGIPKNQLITRIAFVDFDGKHALEMASKGICLDKKFILEHCPKIAKGINNLVNWIRNQ